MISVSRPPVNAQWVKSDCQVWFGRSAANLWNELRGRFCGCGTTRPARLRIRQMVALEGVWPSRSRWARIVSAPASRPAVGQLIAQLQDPGGDLCRGLVRRRQRPRRPRLQRRLALIQPAVMQAMDQRFGDAVTGGDLPVGESFDDNSLDQHLGFAHPATLPAARSQCLETSRPNPRDRSQRPATCVHKVLKPDTSLATTVMSRDIVHRCVETSLILGRARPMAGLFCFARTVRSEEVLN